VTDSEDAMEAYLRAEVGDVVSAETLREFCDQSGPNIAWLAAHGVAWWSTRPRAPSDTPRGTSSMDSMRPAVPRSVCAPTSM
jgi:3-oxo-5alpha-steroid 4-dehydrogenase